MEYLAKEKLEKLTTKRLLNLYKSLRQTGKLPYPNLTEEFWEYKDLVKNVLETREHIDDKI